jgi:hypothetical protein
MNLLVLSEARQLHVSFIGGHHNMLHRQLLLLLAISWPVMIKRQAPIVNFALSSIPKTSTSCRYTSSIVLGMLLLLLSPLCPLPAQMPCCVHKRSEPSNAQDADGPVGEEGGPFPVAAVTAAAGWLVTPHAVVLCRGSRHTGQHCRDGKRAGTNADCLSACLNAAC